MSSVCFRIEAYEDCYSCPEYNLRGYTDIRELIERCWKKYAFSENEE